MKKQNSDLFEFVPIFRSSEYVSKEKGTELQGANFFYLDNSQHLVEEDIRSFMKERMDVPAIIIDCWGNKATSQLIKMVPRESRILLLGNLSEKERLDIDTTDFFMLSKRIEGFNLLKYLHDCLPKERRKTFYDFVREDFDENPKSGDIFCDTSKVEMMESNEAPQIFKLEEIEKALTVLDKTPQARVLLECSKFE